MLEQIIQLKNRLARHMRDSAINSSLKEVGKFVDGLKAMSDEDLGVIVAVHTVIRINMEMKQFLPEGLLFDPDLQDANAMGRYQMDLNKLIKQFNRKRQPTDAVATMVLSYTLRCFNVVELRPLGHAMWKELGRGFQHAKQALKDGEKEKSEKFPGRVWQEYNRYPVGFAPL